MEWILRIAALCVAFLLAGAAYLRRRSKDRRRSRVHIPGVTITGYPGFTPEELAEAQEAAAAAHPVLPRLEALDYELALRLDRSLEFEELRQFFGAYFHQDWDDDHDDEDGVVRLYLEDNAHLPQDVAKLLEEMDTLLAFGLNDEELHEALVVLGSYLGRRY